VPIPGIEVTPAALRADLAAMLPAYMLPSQWQAVDELPRMADGSVDHSELRRGFAERPAVSR
jgi:non-ribosomal peptide synthetase component E (peptide arylation enzyme)